MPESKTSPAARLEGLSLDGGWLVGKPILQDEGRSGGFFSRSYEVVSPVGKRAFLKALDYWKAFDWPEPPRAMQALTATYNFEKELLQKCRGMDRIVHGIAAGRVIVDDNGPMGSVDYLILEVGDGDVRAQLARLEQHDVAWKLRSLHHVATGLKQLHSAGIAHRDLKPANVIVFNGLVSKVGDLGCAVERANLRIEEEFRFDGDKRYAPLELLFPHIDPDWDRHHRGTDFYHLGSLAVYLFDGVILTHQVVAELDPKHHPNVWAGTYRDVLPYVREAFDRSLQRFGENIVVEGVREDLLQLIRQLTDPDPTLRGDSISRERGGNPFSLERVVSRLDLLASKTAFRRRQV